MTDPVKNLLETGQPSEILEAAFESSEYQRIPGDDRYDVYRGEDILVIGVPGEGVYIETLEEQDSGHRYDFVEQEPWSYARETTYEFQGFWKEIMEDVENLIPDDTGKASKWERLEKQIPETRASMDYGSTVTKPGSYSIYRYQGEKGAAMLEFDSNHLRLHEKGRIDFPALETTEGLQLVKVVTGIPEDRIHETL